MNKQRRKEIKNVIDLLENAKCSLENILADEEDYFDNMPENLQGSMRGEESENAIDVLQDSIDEIESCIDDLNEII